MTWREDAETAGHVTWREDAEVVRRGLREYHDSVHMSKGMDALTLLTAALGAAEDMASRWPDTAEMCAAIARAALSASESGT